MSDVTAWLTRGGDHLKELERVIGRWFTPLVNMIN